MPTTQQDIALNQVKDWLENIVIGLNLCPFAKKPFKQKQIHYLVTDSTNDYDLLTELYDQLVLLDNAAESEIETSIIIMTEHLIDFDQYNDFLDLADQLIDNNDWRGVFQIASFHPDYQFAGTNPADAENLTNRSPFPLLHLLRENSLDKAVESHPNVDAIPQQNILKMNQLTKQQISELFHYLPD
ncbi:DUF1415 domain-containing protein [Catenovulum sp. 2E275]|uniref:DUF1415 domain-containing protein n=1 Tax=Catenovulum sp. 2E275 TaxID=2980497 RepID=UPI0021D2F6F0|nr:DUF1415 domain-containing protein [Catenovulum sp. 2E275]MCU4675853.1 DUF1415 domain-containing protein [Catenovulum sp. 2E275]